MTTAHRPTWTPAQGGKGKYDSSLGLISQQTSVRDAPAHTKLKFRHDVETKDEEEMKRELEQREAKHFDDIRKEEEKRAGITAITGAADEAKTSRPSKLLAITTDEADEDLPEDDESADESDSDSDSDDDDDDTAQLLAELEKIKKERAAEQARKEELKAEEESRVRLASIVKGNPLLNDGQSGDFTVKRRWDEDTVFKNCARGEKQSKKPRYINDTLRSESHMKFMERYIK
ncbi:hypothetical protein PTSG_05731 [Salpingoeca rosetta]|uniref:Cwf15/Cwc15 cell cycle control protein n=1 Tax=Salpingoeca rosetta (strain ATCC 50818 / BSB-021) TaxID=946362 RepID=F2UB24_SALR5|nr:uncharacterized protein PTSG_05731 [Salpingoeca rosetta]EGD74037.1 hypothetical protein PTSG_05731 [Salpingoeca rosetta]|eukprot:XP_004993599.1 hypothetical protein PTSG_05731 [Salpingoeca rosetta]